MVAMSMVPDRHPWQNNLIFVCMFVASVSIPFFLGDLVAAISSLVALDYVAALIRRSAGSLEWHDIAYYQVLPAAALFVGVELYFAWRGRVYLEEEVHPRYARNLAERLSLTAEIGAARLAQLRLLPDAPPRIAGLSIAGSCVPAREVGGDFFDYYALDDHRLGVFLAEGGNRELGSAMTIALAKGFLMYTARLDLSPVEILRRLRPALASVLRGNDTNLTVLYAVIDGRTGSVRYARAGEWPRLAINGKALAEEIVADRSDGFTIRHGAATLAPFDSIFFYTDGWASQIAGRMRSGPEEFLADTARKLGDVSAGELHSALVQAALRKKDAPPDDVTAVMVRREEPSMQAVGGIA
jgi:serine phosphatase RsbU (regulator of sigma subunit)